MALMLILLPIVAGCALFALPRGERLWSRVIGCAVAADTFAVPFLCDDAGGAFSVRWLSRPFTASLHFAWSGVSLWLVLLLALCTFCAIVATNVAQTRTLIALLLLLEGTMMGVFTARDILAFALFWDLMLLPPFFALVEWGTHRETAWRFLIYNFSGGLTLLLATAAFGILSGSTDVIGSTHQFAGSWAPWIFAGFAFAFAVKTPLWPLHTWMPATYADSPPPMVAVISAVQSKAGLYGFIVIGLPFLRTAMADWRGLIVALALVSLLYGAFVALTQTDTKRIVAYSSLSHLGLIVLAIASFNPIALQGAVVYIVAHGLFSAALFLILGYMEEREETRSISKLGGLGANNPKLGGAFTIAALAALGLPGLAGFAGEIVILTGVFKAGYIWPALITLVPIVIASAYMLRLLQDAINGPMIATLPQRRDLTFAEALAVAPLLAALLFIGIYPHAILTAVLR